MSPSTFAGFRFPTEVILVSARWYLRCGLSCRDIEELFAERGVQVEHVTVYQWVQRFTPLVAARPSMPATLESGANEVGMSLNADRHL
jgi:transposase-like protein